LAQAALRTKRYIPISSRGFIDPRRSFSVRRMECQSICGVWDASWQNSTLDIRYFQGRMSRSNLRVSWRFSVHPRSISSRKVAAKSCSSIPWRRRPSSKDLRQALKCDDEAFLDFIARCLRWDPARRLTPHEASMHEFITGVRINNGRKGHVANAVNSPIKRVNSVTTPGAVRPLPQPPATSFKHGMAARQPDSAASSPSKLSQQRRQSNFNAIQPGLTAKRASHAAMAASASSSTSTLTRVTTGQRASGKPDLAAAAAAASLLR
jgi:serine/threonine protein kinase